jgi:hypothetical protein
MLEAQCAAQALSAMERAVSLIKENRNIEPSVRASLSVRAGTPVLLIDRRK